jgi:excisionase family DNA binding protein
MPEIHPNELYSSKEAKEFLKVSTSTIKRYLKKGIIKANKIGGRYKILGKELLRLISPKVENKATKVYYKLKEKTQKVIEKW